MSEEMTIEEQQGTPITIEQLVVALVWELQQLRMSVDALKESVNGLHTTLIENEE